MPAGEVRTPPLRAQPLWARVDENRVKLAVFVTLYVGGSAILLTLALVVVPGVPLGLGADFADLVPAAVWFARLPWVAGAALACLLAIGALIAAVQLANAEDWVRNRFAGVPIEPGEEPDLEGVVADIAIAAGLTRPPAIVLLETPNVNAYALGTARKRATLGVTRGMLRALDAGEQRAVIATLVARIVSGDILFATALAALMGPLKAVRESKDIGRELGGCLDGCSGPATDGCGRGCADGCVDGCGSIDSDSAGGCLGAIAIAAFLAVVAAITYAAVVTAAWIVTMWGRVLQRTTYEKADAEGMLLLKDPGPMISALRTAIVASTGIGDGDPSYDGILYAPASGTRAIEKVERRRFARLCEVLGVDGAAAMLEAPPAAPAGPDDGPAATA